jgi:catechol 2,3-dioxygenase-like lactoylglutathione lyase family enzyme
LAFKRSLGELAFLYFPLVMNPLMNESLIIPAALSAYIIGLAHVGFVVEALSEQLDIYRQRYGLADEAITVTPPFSEPASVARFAFVHIAEGVELELIEPVSAAMKAQLGLVTGANASGPGGINHIAYRVADLDAVFNALQQQGIRAGHVTPEGVINTGRSKIVYLNPDDFGGALIELIEPNTGVG